MTAGSAAGATPQRPNDDKARAALLSSRNLAVAGAALLLVLIVVLVLHYRSGSARRRYDAVLKASLDRLVTAQEGFYYDSTRYAVALRALPTVKLPPGVHVDLFNPDRRSWWAIASHDGWPARHCVVWVGTAPPGFPLEARAPEEETKPLCYDTPQLGAIAPRRS
jgi:hypothetical protein